MSLGDRSFGLVEGVLWYDSVTCAENTSWCGTMRWCELLRAVRPRSLLGRRDAGHMIWKMRLGYGGLWMVVWFTIIAAFFVLLWRISYVWINSRIRLSRLTRSACPFLVSTIWFSAMTILTTAAFLKVIRRPRYYSILNLRCCCLYFVDVLFKGIRYLSGVLFSLWLCLSGCVLRLVPWLMKQTCLWLHLRWS